MYCNVLQRGVLLYIYIYITKPSVYFTNGVPLHGTVQYGSLWGGSLGAVPGTFLVPPRGVATGVPGCAGATQSGSWHT